MSASDPSSKCVWQSVAVVVILSLLLASAFGVAHRIHANCAGSKRRKRNNQSKLQQQQMAISGVPITANGTHQNQAARVALTTAPDGSPYGGAGVTTSAYSPQHHDMLNQVLADAVWRALQLPHVPNRATSPAQVYQTLLQDYAAVLRADVRYTPDNQAFTDYDILKQLASVAVRRPQADWHHLVLLLQLQPQFRPAVTALLTGNITDMARWIGAATTSVVQSMQYIVQAQARAGPGSATRLLQADSQYALADATARVLSTVLQRVADRGDYLRRAKQNGWYVYIEPVGAGTKNELHRMKHSSQGPWNNDTTTQWQEDYQAVQYYNGATPRDGLQSILDAQQFLPQLRVAWFPPAAQT